MEIVERLSHLILKTCDQYIFRLTLEMHLYKAL